MLVDIEACLFETSSLVSASSVLTEFPLCGCLHQSLGNGSELLEATPATPHAVGSLMGMLWPVKCQVPLHSVLSSD